MVQIPDKQPATNRPKDTGPSGKITSLARKRKSKSPSRNKKKTTAAKRSPVVDEETDLAKTVGTHPTQRT